MKILKHLKADWFKYGFETLAVVVGILVAFALDNWNDTRKENEIERDLLEQFTDDLRSDIESINFVNYWYGKTIFSCEVLVDHLKNRKPFHDSLKIHFDLWNDFEKLYINSGAISNLNSRGVELISNTSLRNHILQMYNQHLPYGLKSNDYFREDHVHMSYKVHLERIEPILWRESAMPNDYNALFEDQVFINHVQWIKNAAMFNKEGNAQLIGEIYSLIGFIDQELKK